MPLIRLGQFGSTVRRTSSAPSDASLRQECASFLESLFRAGAFPGRAPDDAYFVRCGRDTMTEDDIDNGRLTILIGIAPLRPGEFVTFRIGQLMPRSTEMFNTAGSPSERLCLREHPLVAEKRVPPPGSTAWIPSRAGSRSATASTGALVPAGSQNVRVAYRHGAETN